MPTYEYACTACADRIEVVQSFSDAALTECPACGGLLRKVFSPVGVVFKGSGFYKTDSRGASKPAASTAPAESSSSPSSSESAGSAPAAPAAPAKDAAPSSTAAPAKAAS